MMEKRVFYPSMLILGMLMLLCRVTLTAQDNNTTINHATRFAVSPPLRELSKLPSPPQYGFHRGQPGSPHSETPRRTGSGYGGAELDRW